MKSETYPLALPADLIQELRRTAKETGLSIADAMRQSMKLGLPTLRAQVSSQTITSMTEEEARRAYSARPEWDELESVMARRPIAPPDDF